MESAEKEILLQMAGLMQDYFFGTVSKTEKFGIV